MKMSRRNSVLIDCLYIAVAIAFGLYLQLREPFSTLSAFTIGKGIGIGIGLFAVSAAVPAIIWGIKFTSKATAFPTIIWIMTGSLLAFVMELGDRASNAGGGAAIDLNEKGRNEVWKGAKEGCVSTQRQSNLNRAVGITNQQIETYCTCFADALVKTVTVDEIRYVATNGKQPDSLQDKVLQAGPKCSSVALVAPPVVPTTKPSVFDAPATPAASVFVDLPEVVVNLSNTGADRTQYLKVQVVLELPDQQLMQQIQPVMPRVLDTFQTYLRELRPTDLDGSSGLYRLKQELTRRINAAIAPNKVSAVLFKEIVVQ
jgi:flagellar basal body-associated protein FliL